MANLLPKETLEFVWKGYRSRLILVGALVFLATAILAGLALLPAYVALRIELNSQEKQIAAAAIQSDTDSQTRAERNDILRAKALLVRIAPVVFATSSPTEVIGAALLLRPKGVVLERISFVSGGNGSITITGDSSGREGINEYREALSKDGRFKSVSVPVGALVGGDGGRFTITLTGAF